jgi:hypothetical protein
MVDDKHVGEKNQTQQVAQNPSNNSTVHAQNKTSSQAQTTSASNSTKSIHPVHIKTSNTTQGAKHFLKINFSNSTHSQLNKTGRLHLTKQFFENATASPQSLSKLNPYGDFSTFEQSIEQMKPLENQEQTEIIKKKLIQKLATKKKLPKQSNQLVKVSKVNLRSPEKLPVLP